MTNRPHFLDEEPPPPAASETAAPTGPPPADLPPGPILLEAEPDAPTMLQATWQPQNLLVPPAPVGTVPWIALGTIVVIVSLVLLSGLAFVFDMAKRSAVLGVVSGLSLGLGFGLIGYGICREWLSYRQLKTVDHTRAALSGRTMSIETLRAAALGWLEQVHASLPEAEAAATAIRSAATPIEIQAILRNRVADPLREAAKTIGRRAAVQSASLIAISPHASWDGLIAGVRAVLIIRAVARLFGLRPGMAMTIALFRKVAWTAAGTAGIELASQGLADQVLGAMPIVKHIAASVPGSGVAALRLYRLATITAEACCPVAG
jgi:putative membrane protein